jgi:hypothetical protein
MDADAADSPLMQTLLEALEKNDGITIQNILLNSPNPDILECLLTHKTGIVRQTTSELIKNNTGENLELQRALIDYMYTDAYRTHSAKNKYDTFYTSCVLLNHKMIPIYLARNVKDQNLFGKLLKIPDEKLLISIIRTLSQRYAVEDQWPESDRLPIANALIDAGVDSPEAYATIANQYNWRQGAKTLAQAPHPVLALKALLRSDEEDLSTLEGQLQGAVSTLTATDQQYYFIACSIPLDEVTFEQIGILLDKTYYAAMVGSYLALFQDYNKPGPKESYLSFKNWKIPSPLPEDLDNLRRNQQALSKVLAAEWWLANDSRFSPANMSRSLDKVFLAPKDSTPEECLSDTQTPEIIDPPHAHQPYNPHDYTR